jgi:hypothetical protein
MHGGMPETANQAPIWRAGARLATSQAESAFVIIHVVRALDTLSLSDASIAFATAGTPMRAVRTDESGRAAVHLKAGRLSLTVAHMGNKRYIDTVTVRGGFADTLRIGLGTERICFM